MNIADSVQEVEKNAFGNVNTSAVVNYEGNADSWNSITLEKQGNTVLSDSAPNYECIMDSTFGIVRPTSLGNCFYSSPSELSFSNFYGGYCSSDSHSYIDVNDAFFGRDANQIFVSIPKDSYVTVRFPHVLYFAEDSCLYLSTTGIVDEHADFYAVMENGDLQFMFTAIEDKESHRIPLHSLGGGIVGLKIVGKDLDGDSPGFDVVDLYLLAHETEIASDYHSNTTVMMTREGKTYNLLKEEQTFNKKTEEVVSIIVDPDWQNHVPGYISVTQHGKTILKNEGGAFVDLAPGRLFSPQESVYIALIDQDGNVVETRRTTLRIVPDVDTESYYAAKEKRKFYITAKGTRYPRPVGFTVSVDGRTYTGYESGKHFYDQISAEINPAEDKTVTVTKDGYYDYSVPAGLTGGTNEVSMIPTSVTGPYLQALLYDRSGTGRPWFPNLLVQNCGLPESNPVSGQKRTVSLYPVAGWNGHGEGRIFLEQGDTRLELKNATMNEIDWSSQSFTEGQPVYLCAVAGDGVQVREKLVGEVYRTRDSNLKIDLGEAVESDADKAGNKDLDILGGNSLGFSLGGTAPLSFTVKDDGSVEGTIGLTLAKDSYKESAFGEIKEMLSRFADPGQSAQLHDIAGYLDELADEGITPAYAHSTLGVSGKAQVIGYFSGSLVDGRFGFTELKAALVFSGGVSYTWNTFVPVVVAEVPAYIKMEIKAKVETSLKMKYNDAMEKLVSDGKQHLTGKLSLSGEAGPGWEGYVSCGIKGTGSLKVKTEIPIRIPETTMTLQGTISVVGSLLGINGEWEIFSTREKVFFDGAEEGYWCWKNTGEDGILQTVEFRPDLTAHLMTASSGDAVFRGVSGYSAPCLARLSDGRLLAVWTADVAGRSAVDKNGVYYSLKDGDSWSAPALVRDDGTGDAVPRLFRTDGTVCLAWQNYAKAFRQDTLPSFQTVSQQVSYATASFDETTGTWSEPEQKDEAWYRQIAGADLPGDYPGEWPASMSARQVLTGGGIRAVLYTGEDDSGTEQVFGLFDDGFGWGNPVQLTEEETGVNGFGAELEQGMLCLLYTTGEYGNSDLVYSQQGLAADLTVRWADYVRQTLIPGGELTVKLDVANCGTAAADGVRLRVKNGDALLREEEILTRFAPGDETVLYIGCPLPEAPDFDSLRVEAIPLTGSDTRPGDNAADLRLYRTDLSLESVSAVTDGARTEVVTLVVNRGTAPAGETVLTFRQGKPDGTVLGTAPVPAVGPGDVESVSASLKGLQAGEMVYVEAARIGEENLIGNNTSQALVLASDPVGLRLSAVAKKEQRSVLVTVNAENRTLSETGPITLVVALCRTDTGQQVDCRVIPDVTVKGLGSYTGEAVFGTDLPDGLTWKAFALDVAGIPLAESVSGAVS